MPVIKTLLLFILSCIRVNFFILRIAIVKALLPRMPPPNWRKEENISANGVQVDYDSRIVKLWKPASTSGPDEEAAHFEIPNSYTAYALLVDSLKANITPTKPSIVGFDFNLDSAAHHDSTRHPFLTPVRPPIKEIGFTVLRNASDRVTEILRENRRRLDAGEDLNTIRKAARRKRAMEISAVRKGRAKPFSLA